MLLPTGNTLQEKADPILTGVIGTSKLVNNGKGKLQFTLEQAMKAQRGSRGIALLFLQPRR